MNAPRPADTVNHMGLLDNLAGPMLAELETEARKVRARFPAEFVAAAICSAALKFLIQFATNAGVPKGFADKYKLTPDQAKALYDDVLTSALTRV